SVPLIIYALYIPIIFVIYTIQVVIVITNKSKPQFRSSYFSLFIIEGVTGLSTTIITTITHRLVLFPEVNSYYANFPANAFTTALYFASYYYPACQEYVNICIALNRLSAITMVKKYEKVWSRLIWLFIPAIFGLPFISYYHLVDSQAFFFSPEKGIWIIQYDNSARPWIIQRSNRVNSFYLYLVCSITSLSLNLATLIMLRCKAMEKVSSIELRLFLLGFCSFLCEVPMVVQQ
ncbi:hypothetical protein PMAYCL1PPCAC_22050, partial [Pristionchus mayeri]